ncbi:MAG: phage tail protein [Chitinivibrionales bacterium]|nr:phage tail protein [Chitinivibrionales bacterium]
MAQYPLPAFHFQVDWGGSKGTEVGFSEVSGLTIERQVVEYRDGASKEYGPVKMPGIPKFGNITLKRGITKADNDFYAWINTTALNTVERRDLTISLLNENHEPAMTWKVKNCFPVKVEGPGLKSTGNEVAIESLEVAHEGLTIEAE